MIQRIVLGAGAFALSAVFMIPTTATAAAVTGNVTCTLKGSASIAPGLPLQSPGNATKKLKTKVTFTGTLENCTGIQAGTKKGAQIEAGTIVAKAKTATDVGMPLPSCAGLTAPTTPTILKATVKFTNAGKTIATSKVDLTLGAAAISPTLTVSFPALGAVSGGNGFKGQYMTAIAVLDKGAADLAALCTGGASTTFNFTGVHGASTLETP